MHIIVLISKQEALSETEGGMLGRGCLSTVVHCFHFHNPFFQFIFPAVAEVMPSHGIIIEAEE